MCAPLTRDLFAIAKFSFRFNRNTHRQTGCCYYYSDTQHVYGVHNINFVVQNAVKGKACIDVFDVVGGQDTCKTVSPSSVCKNSVTTSAPTTTTPSGGDVNESKCALPLKNNSVSVTSALVMKEVDV